MGNGTSIGRVRGLGSARSGGHHWVFDRVLAIGNLVATLWFVASLVMLPNLSHQTVTEWLARPVPATMMALLVITSFWHGKMGMQVMLEDYLHDHGTRFAVVSLVNFAAFAGGAFGLLCVLRLASGGA